MTVRKPRGAPAQDADLTWFFCSMACDVGQKSIHGAIIDMGVSGVSSASPYGCSRTPSQRALDAAGDGRRMSAAYGAISETHQVMLCAAYGPQGKIPKEMRDAYRPFPGVVMLTETAERAFAAAVHERGQRKPSTLATAAATQMRENGIVDWLRYQSVRENRALVAAMQAEAGELLAAAHAAWTIALEAADPPWFARRLGLSRDRGDAGRRVTVVRHVEAMEPRFASEVGE